MLGKIFVRRMTSLAEPLQKLSKGHYPYPNNPQYKKLMQKQSLFCADDGKLVWQKLPTDMLLYRGIIALVTSGVLYSVYGLARLASPPKND